MMNTSRMRFRAYLCALAAKASLLLVLLSGLLMAACGSDSERPVPPDSNLFGIQLHSWDDLREMEMLLLKGIAHFKVDLNYVRDEDVCENNGVSAPCILLNHNIPNMSRRYDTSADLLSALGNMQSKYNLHSRLFTVALCAKYRSVKGSNPGDDPTFLETMDRFFQAYFDRSDVAGVFEFVLDGALSPKYPSLYDRWRPLVATWNPSGDPQDAALSNDGPGYDRYQVLNPSADIWGHVPRKLKYMAESVQPSFGKFAETSYPYQVWEPSGQERMSDVVSYYRPLQTGHQLLFAYNPDPVQGFLYIARDYGFAGRDYGYRFVNGTPQPKTKVRRDGDKKTYVAMVNGGEGLLHVWRFFPDASEGLNRVQYRYWVVDPDLLAYEDPENVGSFSVEDYLAGVASSGDKVFLLTETGRLYGLDLASSHLSDLGTPVQGVKGLSAAFVDPTHLVMAGAAKGDDRLCLANYDIVAGEPVQKGVCRQLPGKKGAGLVSAGIGEDGIIAISTSDGQVYKTALDVGGDGMIRFEEASTWSLMDVGSSVSAVSGQGISVIVAGDSYCWNSEMHNKSASVAVCSQTPVSMPEILSYTHGDSAELKGFNANRYITPCETSIFHGTFSTGSFPSVCIAEVNGATKAVVSYWGSSAECLLRESYFCGCAESFHGPQLVSWPIYTPSWAKPR